MYKTNLMKNEDVFLIVHIFHICKYKYVFNSYEKVI